MDIELRTDGDWRNTKLFVDGAEAKFVKTIRILRDGKSTATITAGMPTTGKIPYVPYADIEIERYKSDENGIFAGPQLEKIRFQKVNIVKGA